MAASKPQPHDWRVSLWFLTDWAGWVGLSFAFVEAKDRDHAMAKCLQPAVKMGFKVDKDTVIKAEYEDGQGRL